MSTPRAFQLVGLLLIVAAGLLYTYHALSAWPWMTLGLVGFGALIALISTMALVRPSRPAQPQAHTLSHEL